MFVWMIVQILIESLPISSSGHVQLAARLYSYFGWTLSSAHQETVDFILHVPALIIMLCYFFTSWWYMIMHRHFAFSQLREWSTYRSMLRPMIFVFVADIVTFAWWMSGSAGYANNYSCSLTVGFFITACALYMTRWAKGSKKIDWDLKDGLILGFVQGFALMPGVSRFATTFCMGTILGYRARDAFAISFMIQCPLVLAACIKAILQIVSEPTILDQIFDFWMLFGIVGMSFISYKLLTFMGYLIDRNWLWYLAWYMILPIVAAILI